MKGRSSGEKYAVAIDEFGSCVYGSIKWKEMKGRSLLSEWFTVEDEAMMRLHLQNNWEMWTEVANFSEEQRANKTKPTKESHFTNEAKKARKDEGWSVQGRNFFYWHCRFVQEDRDNHGAPFDAWYLDRHQKAGGKRGQREKAIEDLGQEILVWGEEGSVPEADYTELKEKMYASMVGSSVAV